MAERKLFKFYKSYYDVACELADKDRLAFYDAIMQRQFLGIEPKLKGIAKLAYVSQKYNIDAQVKGWEDRMNEKLLDNQSITDPIQGGASGGASGGIAGGMAGGGIQEEVEEKEKEKEKEKVKEEVEVKRNIGEKQKLVFPYHSEKFMFLWNELVKMPKWRKKPFSALQLTLHKLSEFEEDFVIELIENAITGNYQGIIFSNTKEKYEQFKQQKYGGENIRNNAKKQGISKQELAEVLYEHFQNRDNSGG